MNSKSLNVILSVITLIVLYNYLKIIPSDAYENQITALHNEIATMKVERVKMDSKLMTLQEKLSMEE